MAIFLRVRLYATDDIFTPGCQSDLGSNWGPFCPKWDKPGTFSDHISVHISILPWWHVGVFLSYSTNICHIMGNRSLVLMHSGISNGYQLLCDAHAVLEPHRGTAVFFFTHYRPFPLFLFMCLSLLTVLFLFLGASIVCVSNTIYRGQQIVLWFPDRTSVCKHPWHHSA